MNGPDALEMRCPLLSRKQTSIGRRRKVGFLDLIPKSLRTNQTHAPPDYGGPERFNAQIIEGTDISAALVIRSVA